MNESLAHAPRYTGKIRTKYAEAAEQTDIPVMVEVVGASDALGGFESGLVAHWLGPVMSVVSGGVGTILVVIAVAKIWPEIRRYGRLE